MVRLKDIAKKCYYKFNIFQFHYGTIKSIPQEESAVYDANFNSTMVRLKERIYGKFVPRCAFQFHYGTIKSLSRSSSEYILRHFNSTMVRLKGRGSGCKRRMIINFNSTMVRLKDADAVQKDLYPAVFQFHYGTIKSVQNRLFQFLKVISIPLWYD